METSSESTMARSNTNPDTNPTAGSMTLLLQLTREGGPAEPIGREMFTQYCQTDPERLFEVIYHRMDEYLEEIDNLERLRGTLVDETDTLKEQIKTKDDAIADLIEERNRFRHTFTQQAQEKHGGY
jgi:hypothetical protein